MSDMSPHQIRQLNEYTEDDDLYDELSEGMRDIQRDITILLEDGPDFGPHNDRSKTAVATLTIPADDIGRLDAKSVYRLLTRGRLPKTWVKEMKDWLDDRGWWLRHYKHVDLEMRQQRMSDTDGGYPAVGYLRVDIVISTGGVAHTSV